MGRADSPLAGKVVFVVGARRSGTYWLQRLVTAHPLVAAVPSETYLLVAVAKLLESFHHADRDVQYTGRMWADRELLLDATRQFCDRMLGQFVVGDDDRVSERTPWHVRHLDLIAELYPDAYCIHIYRDGRDAARSLRGMDWYDGSLEDAAAEWRTSVLAAREGPRPERYTEVRYEDLLADPRARVLELYTFLGLEADDEAMAAVEVQAKTKVHTDPLYGAMAEKWRTVLTEEEQATVLSIAGDAFVAYGYAAEDEVANAAARHTSLSHRYRRLGRHWRGNG